MTPEELETLGLKVGDSVTLLAACPLCAAEVRIGMDDHGNLRLAPHGECDGSNAVIEIGGPLGQTQ